MKEQAFGDAKSNDNLTTIKKERNNLNASVIGGCDCKNLTHTK
jgi:hypothetical protein